MMCILNKQRLRNLKSRLRVNISGVAALEFAISLPFFLTLGAMSIDLTRFALAHLRLSQVALNLADNTSRMGVGAANTVTDLREVDVNDAFEAVRDQGASLGLTTNGRVILSSLERSPVSGFGQRIRWQRCIGLRSGANFDSHYGVATPLTTAGTQNGSSYWGLSAPSGMGPAGGVINAPPNSAVMFVEINYEFTPIFGPAFGWIQGGSVIRYTASFIVRDNRGFSNTSTPPILRNPNPAATRSTCNLYTV